MWTRLATAVTLCWALTGCDFSAHADANALSDDAQNRHIIADLRSSGMDLSRPMKIEFFLYVPAESDAHRAADDLANRGFTVDVQEPGEILPNGDRSNSWRTDATARHLVQLAFLRSAEQTMKREARKYRGAYGGWQTDVIP